jgi:hypothetical protein
MDQTKIPLPQLKILIMMLAIPPMSPWIVSAAGLGASVEGILKFQGISLEPSTWKVMGRERFSGGGTRAFNDKNDQ